MTELFAGQSDEGAFMGIAKAPPGPVFTVRVDAVASPSQLILGGLGGPSHDTAHEGTGRDN